MASTSAAATIEKAEPITATPAAGQLIEHEGKTYETVREGQAYILIPPNTQKHVNPQAKVKDGDETVAQSVFYNPIQQFNRDLSVLAIKAFGDDWLDRKRQRGGKNQNRNQNKNKRKRERERAGENKDGAVKLRKAEDGTVVVVENGQAPITDVAAENEADATKAANTEPAAGSDEQTTTADLPAGAALNGQELPNGEPAKPKGPQFRILDALSATGLRALRYAKEIPYVTAVVANDMNPNAIKSMQLNIKHNQLESSITPNLGDAIGHMYSVAYPPTNSHGPKHITGKYDVVDLDPYGTAAPFVDAALQSVNDGGLLCVTCTDSGVFASTGYCEKTYALYGGMPIKGPHMHEGGLRLIIQSIATAASKHGIAIEPLLSLSIDFYVRTFIRVRRSPADVKFLAGKSMMVYGCDAGCGSWTTNMLGRNIKQSGKNDTIWYKHTIAQAPSADRLCEHCGSKTHVAGPMWGGPIHNAAFIEKILDDLETVDPEVYQTTPRIEGMLTTALSELAVSNEVTQYKNDRKEGEDMIPKTPPQTIDPHPFFINPSALAKVIHCISPPSDPLKGALRHAGYRATRSHCQPGSIKTDAPWSAIWEIMREWVRQRQPIKEGSLKENTPGWRIMQAARKVEDETTIQTAVEGSTDTEKGATRMVVKFDEVLGKDKPVGKKIVRYQQNPRENWGPMTKAKGSG